MKIKPEHYAHLREIMRATIALVPDMAAYRARLESNPRIKDVDKRLRWDILYATRDASQWVSSALYPYCNDEHIDTALRQIMRELQQ